jgi:hypothetical protein
VCGPKGEVFPRPEGWYVDGKNVRLDKLSVGAITRIFAARKFKPAASELAWNARLSKQLPWKKIWKMKSTFATPRDQFTGLRLQHRNLFTAAREDPPMHECRCEGCTETENQLHLCECSTLRNEYWTHLVKVGTDSGMPPPEEITDFLATGAMSDTKVISAHYSVLWFIGWRCLYAEIVHSRIENQKLDLQRALKRATAMTIGRLRAHGKGWANWISAGRFHRKPRVIPRSHQNKGLFRSDRHGEYELAEPLVDLAKRLEIWKDRPRPTQLTPATAPRTRMDPRPPRMRGLTD